MVEPHKGQRLKQVKHDNSRVDKLIVKKQEDCGDIDKNTYLTR